MACDAKDYGCQMLNDDEIVTIVQEESYRPTLSTMKRMKTRTTTTKEARVYQILVRFLSYRLWSGTNNNQSAVLLTYCCSRESDTLERKMVQRKVSDYFSR
ncbi:uncharacterized protein TNCV_246131 [Trichonephila clavipes]|nr:uncharacterized protein TNCV_246131 [Trichonephila clavipes]